LVTGVVRWTAQVHTRTLADEVVRGPDGRALHAPLSSCPGSC